ncbi:MAG: class I SAM-dependent methyltransferase [Pseudomonadota bacterium]
MHPEAQKVIDLYRRHARAWAAQRGAQLPERAWLERFLKRLPQSPSILDLGCGSGDPIDRFLIAQGCTLTGIDASPELIEIARARLPEATWVTSDMRNLHLDRTFDGLLAWHSTFHLTPEDQRAMFAVFERHAAEGAALMFTSGPREGEAIGAFQGEALYHASLDGQEYRALMDQHGFEVVDHVVEDPDCGLVTVWLARFVGQGWRADARAQGEQNRAAGPLQG